MNRLFLFKQVLEECRQRQQQLPDFPPLRSIEKQLAYLVDLEEGRRSDKQLLANLNLGLLAARELEPYDMEFANRIYEVAKAIRSIKVKHWNGNVQNRC